MPKNRRSVVILSAAAALLIMLTFPPSSLVGRGDTVILKNGVIYRGTVDKDNTIVWVYDGLKRVIIRDSKIAKIDTDTAPVNPETFDIEQPLTVHAGSMPKEVISVTASPWNDRGRRPFSYEGSRQGRVIRMEQAINKLGPQLVKIRGVDGFWQGQLATSQVPRAIVLGILAKVEQKNQKERIRVARFLIQANWFTDARAELTKILKDFPEDLELRERVSATRDSVVQLEAAETRASIDRLRKAQQYKEAAGLLKTFPEKDVAAEMIAQVEELRRADVARAGADTALADDLRVLSEKLPSKTRVAWKKPIIETLKALKEAPETVRDRFLAWQKVRDDTAKSPEIMFALAMSGYVIGPDAAVEDLSVALTLWTMRDQVQMYLASRDEPAREALLTSLNSTSLPTDEALPILVKKVDVVTRLIQRMVPPLNDDSTTDGKPKIHRVGDDENAAPTEYTVTLPPEYHPLRSYPAVVALHDGKGPAGAITWWSTEAAKRGYIVIAPEYRLSSQETEYKYSSSEHAAVELALRDAKKRYAVDSDRVFLGGQLVGANMAWDLGLAHPDLFAGVVVISGLPFKYVNRYHFNTELTHLYVAIGDLAPAANEVVFNQILKPMIMKAWDITYLEYLKRGLEDLPEEAPAVFDWMDRRRREPSPKSFKAVTARECDNRFFGVVVREFQKGRTTAPEAVDPFGKNLNPATIEMKVSAASNLLTFKTNGVPRFDVWVSPKLIDFKRKMEVKVNNISWYKGMTKPDIGQLLEDVRIRADRQQIYWMKLTAG